MNSSCENSPEKTDKIKTKDSNATQITNKPDETNIEKKKEINMFTKVNISKKKKKKNIKRNKIKKILQSNQIEVEEFRHKDLDCISYIDKNNNIWNDIMKKIGYFNEEEDIIITIS